MRISYCLRLAGMTICTALAISGRASGQSNTTQVETFTAGGVIHCTMPGSSSPGTMGVTFASNATLQTLNFAPGSALFNGTLVDFDGQESFFIASTYHADVDVPVLTGPATVLVSGTGTVGHGGGGGGGCLVTGGNTPLGPTFSSSRLDVATGPGVSLNTTVPFWNASAVPQLNGRAVTTEGPMTITSVDPVNGIVNFTTSGRILVRSDIVPALTTLGMMGLAVGLFGLALVALSRRHAAGSAPGAR